MVSWFCHRRGETAAINKIRGRNHLPAAAEVKLGITDHQLELMVSPAGRRGDEPFDPGLSQLSLLASIQSKFSLP